jgi:hypothetical protein
MDAPQAKSFAHPDPIRHHLTRVDDIDAYSSGHCPVWEDVVFKTKWQLAVDIIDQARRWGIPDRLVVADAGCGDATEFRDALEIRTLTYVLGISKKVGFWARPPKTAIPEYTPAAARNPRMFIRSLSRRKIGRKSVGVKGAKDGWSLASRRCGLSLPMAVLTEIPRIRRYGSLSNVLRTRKNLRSPFARREE